MVDTAGGDVMQWARSRLGTVIKSKYRLDEVIGAGGMAVVFRATHRNQAEFAVKMLLPELSFRKDLVTRFLREGYAANSVKHSGVVQVVDDDIADDGAAFLVMELLHGTGVESLWLNHERRLRVQTAAGIVDQLLDVLGAAHERGIIHRDIKPANLFLTGEGVVKVLDFGIARVRDAIASGGQGTNTGMLLGTPAFMAPEQAKAQSRAIDAQTDLWAAGATLFTLVTGRFVHEGENAPQLLINTATTAARPSFVLHPPGLIVLGSSAEVAASNSGSGASLQYRNYPDVSAVAQDVDIYINEGHVDSGGTSASSPMWAGYAALINEALSNANVGGTVGFANPVLYAVAAGSLNDRSGHDAGAGAFHDINDGRFNQEPQPNKDGYGVDLGFPAVAGYDLSTRLGSPTCHLLNLLSSPAPLTPPTVTPTFTTLFGEIEVGEDDLKAQSQAFLFIDTTSATYSWPLKLDTDGSWDRGTAHTFAFPIPTVAVGDIVDAKVMLDENGQSGPDLDNWDVNGIHIRLGNTFNPLFACLVNESGDDSCDPDQSSGHSDTGFLGDTTDHGVFRLSAVPGSGGQGPNATITIVQENTRFEDTINGPPGLAAQGCPSFEWTLPVKPIHSVHVVIDTGNDGMNGGSSAFVSVVDAKNNDLGSVAVPLSDLPISDRSEIGYTITLNIDQDPSNIAGVLVSFLPDGNDEWHVFGVSAFANGDQVSGQDLCLVRVPEAANNSQQDNTFVFNSGLASHPFARTEASCEGL